MVMLAVDVLGHAPIARPIVGFLVKDRLGQQLFGDNTYLSYADAPQRLSPGERFAAAFRFQMPYLPTGDFSVCAAVADGTQEEHAQHHWIDDALFFRVRSSHLVRGLVGVPMIEIRLGREGGQAPPAGRLEAHEQEP
jgi:lipopolysaccharide transport system ATP-binding protein